MREDIKDDEDNEDNVATSDKIISKSSLKSQLSFFKIFFKSLGPGVITGGADDDPSGIATYSQAGSQFGFGMLWLALFQFPLMTVIQEICGRIGLVTGSGLASAIKKKYSMRVALPLASLLLIANTINIGTDIGAMAASIRLLFPQLSFILATLFFASVIILLEILVPYNKYAKILKYLALSLFAYLATAIIVGGNWNQILVSSIFPHIEFTPSFTMMIVAMYGTTISPYLFFWQASEEAEEDVAKDKIKEIGKGKPKIIKKEVKMMRVDTIIGMAFSQLIAWSIIVTTAGSLHVNGITDIQSADQAAKALEPLIKTFPNSGIISKIIFALGVIGVGLMAIPVLAGSSAYALSDVFGWKEGLDRKFKQAKPFYLIITTSTLIGLFINFSNIDPIKALVYTAVINGVVAVPLLFAIMKIGNDRKFLKGKSNGWVSNAIGWITFVTNGIAVVAMFITWGK